MGLGKTLQALCALEGRSLVAAPTSVLRNWMEEARRFRPELSLCLYHGPRRTLDPKASLTITSHALLRLDRETLGAIDWDAVVIDEAQAIRNPETDLARAAYALRATFRMSLTGTPVENRLVDLWSQLHFLNPGLLGGRSDFEDRYVRPIERGEREALLHLQERIRPFFLRRLKSEVAPELPPRTEITLHSELDAAEQEVYETVRLAARRDVFAKLEKKGGALAALEALLRLRQAAWPSGSRPRSGGFDLFQDRAATHIPGDRCIGGTQVARLFSVDLDARPPRASHGGSRPPVPQTRRLHSRSGRSRRAIPKGCGQVRFFDIAQSRRHRPQLDGGGSRFFFSIPGGIPQWRSRPSTGPTASVKRSPSSSTASSLPVRWKSAFLPCRRKNGLWLTWQPEVLRPP